MASLTTTNTGTMDIVSINDHHPYSGRSAIGSMTRYLFLPYAAVIRPQGPERHLTAEFGLSVHMTSARLPTPLTSKGYPVNIPATARTNPATITAYIASTPAHPKRSSMTSAYACEKGPVIPDASNSGENTSNFGTRVS